MRTSKAARDRLRGLLAKAQSADDGEKAEALADLIIELGLPLGFEESKLKQLLDDLAEAEDALGGLIKLWNETPATYEHAYYAMFKSDGEKQWDKARAYLSERKQTPPATGEGRA